MTAVHTLPSPLGQLTLRADADALTGLWMEGQKYFCRGITSDVKEIDLPVFHQAEAYLTAYFSGAPLPPLPPLRPAGTPFQRAVWALLEEIPRGRVCTYGQLAAELRRRKMGGSPRAVGAAVGRNPISILIPCHRVVGSGGSLTGYAGGVARKRFLLELEGTDLGKLSAPPAERGAAAGDGWTDLPTAVSSASVSPAPEKAAPPEKPGRYRCPCCGCRTLPVPPEQALAYICPVCFWENDVFTGSDTEPSDCNHGLTLRQGRANYRAFGACEARLLPHVRPPRPEELPG